MARTKDTATFNTTAYMATVESMRERREAVHKIGETTFRETGKLPKDVDVKGQFRVSRNAMVREGDVFRLVHGPKLPIFSGCDGTGSMGENVAKAFLAMESIDAMLAGLRNRYQTDLSFGVLQDVGDRHPVFQMAQFESDERSAQHIRELVPDKNGGDPTEDYDFGVAYLDLATRIDINDFYGLKGYAMIVGDQIGRGYVTKEGVHEHLGHVLQGKRVSTRDLCQQLLKTWHLFYVNCGSDGRMPDPETTRWWLDKLGAGRVIEAPNVDLLAEVQIALVYVTETLNPTKDGLVSFLLAGGTNKRITAKDAGEIWNWIEKAGVPMGAQARLPGFDAIPKIGDVFAHWRHAWPIGHPRTGENVTPVEETASKDASDKPGSIPRPINWSMF